MHRAKLAIREYIMTSYFPNGNFIYLYIRTGAFSSSQRVRRATGVGRRSVAAFLSSRRMIIGRGSLGRAPSSPVSASKRTHLISDNTKLKCLILLPYQLFRMHVFFIILVNTFSFYVTDLQTLEIKKNNLLE